MNTLVHELRQIQNCFFPSWLKQSFITPHIILYQHSSNRGKRERATISIFCIFIFLVQKSIHRYVEGETVTILLDFFELLFQSSETKRTSSILLNKNKTASVVISEDHKTLILRLVAGKWQENKTRREIKLTKKWKWNSTASNNTQTLKPLTKLQNLPFISCNFSAAKRTVKWRKLT